MIWFMVIFADIPNTTATFAKVRSIQRALSLYGSWALLVVYDGRTDTTDYIIPRTTTKFDERVFCVAGPSVWNSLSLRVSEISRLHVQFQTSSESTVVNLHFTVLAYTHAFSCFMPSHRLLYCQSAARLDVGLALDLPLLITDYWLLFTRSYPDCATRA